MSKYEEQYENETGESRTNFQHNISPRYLEWLESRLEKAEADRDRYKRELDHRTTINKIASAIDRIERGI